MQKIHQEGFKRVMLQGQILRESKVVKLFWTKIFLNYLYVFTEIIIVSYT
jgi:hypothetical protein